MRGVIVDGDGELSLGGVAIAISHAVADLEVLVVFTETGHIDHRGILYSKVIARYGVKRQRDDGDVTLENQQVVAIGLIGETLGCAVGKPGDEASICAVAM